MILFLAGALSLLLLECLVALGALGYWLIRLWRKQRQEDLALERTIMAAVLCQARQDSQAELMSTPAIYYLPPMGDKRH